ncbi:MAG: aminomethyl-transferring glycine dehydrogenase [Pseudomonadales bacterium]|jgi:glycine dehydrogenase|nr:aminomethyl-transferring glycine dehydrogenase [Pseudomonadales bacterium]
MNSPLSTALSAATLATAGGKTPSDFPPRHIGPDANETAAMLRELGYDSLESFTAAIVPASIRLQRPLTLPGALSEAGALNLLRAMVAADQPGRSFIGQGYYDTLTPAVIQRNVLENPGWYTSYTPYQPEISQGRLNCLLNFQQMTMDLTGLEIANASLLDEATAAAEGMALCKRVSKKPNCNAFFAANTCFAQTLDVVRTRATACGYELIIDSPDKLGDYDVFGALVQYPDAQGALFDLEPAIQKLHAQNALCVVASDLMSLVLLKPPGELGADVVIGSSQRFGIPMGYGGPHAAYFATRDEFKRAVPGRIIGVSVDSRGKRALRMALQTREQHIRREKANSNICTAQALLANMAALYAMYHGPEGLRAIAARIHGYTTQLAEFAAAQGLKPCNATWFDTLSFKPDAATLAAIEARAKAAAIRLHVNDGTLSVSLDECCTLDELTQLAQVLCGAEASFSEAARSAIPAERKRSSAFMEHPVFNLYHSETEMMRFLKRMENQDISLTHSMIPLGSCTMKLNAAAEMYPVTWPQFGRVHPFVDENLVPGYRRMIDELAVMLCEIMGFDGMSMQPNSGAQGEYAGLLSIRRYLDANGQTHRDVCLIPSSAHGTNPATAHMVGMEVVIVACDDKGNVDLGDLKAKAAQHKDKLAALMITYPSTHGVFEEEVKEICAVVHAHGGQVYMDGANLNAQVGLSRPGDIGADVSHTNLHKTFCIPHGGGGPGMGPIGVKAHLIPHLPNHAVVHLSGAKSGNSAVAAAPWGSASILPISWMYLRMMGPDGLKLATQMAMLNANYVASKLAPHYPVLFTGKNGLVAHECIIDLRPLKQASGISESDVAKRLMDFGFHAPTMSFPVAGTLMIEPTESESKAELDRFIDAMITIRQEIAKVAAKEIDAHDNPLVNAPHTLADVAADAWEHPYPRAQAAFPLPWLRDNKYWPPVNRVDNAYGDRNLVCTCPPLEDYQQ